MTTSQYPTQRMREADKAIAAIEMATINQNSERAGLVANTPGSCPAYISANARQVARDARELAEQIHNNAEEYVLTPLLAALTAAVLRHQANVLDEEVSDFEIELDRSTEALNDMKEESDYYMRNIHFNS